MRQWVSWKKFLVYVGVLFCIAFLMELSVFANTVGTSVGSRYSDEEYEKTYKKYPSLKKLAMKGTIPIPGLERTHSLVVEDGNLTDVYADTMIPQGMCVVDDYILVTAYSAGEKRKTTGEDGKEKTITYKYPSVIYVIDKNNLNTDTCGYVCTISLYEKPSGSAIFQHMGDSFVDAKYSKNHVGGICYDGSGRIYIAKSTTREVSVLSKETIKAAIDWAKRENRDAVALSFEQNIFLDNTVSFMTWFEDRLWIGISNFNTEGSVYGFSIKQNEDGTLSATRELSFTVPEKANGVTFYQKGDGRYSMAVNCSACRDVNSIEYTSKMYIYEVSMSGNSITPSAPRASYTMPPMAEEIDIIGDDFYTIFESGANEYEKCQYKTDRITVGSAEEIFYWLKPANTDKVDETYVLENGLILDESVVNTDHEDLSQNVKEITGYYKSQFGSNITSGFLYTDRFLVDSSSVRGSDGPNDCLTKMSVLLACAAYQRDNISGILNKLSFDKINYYNYSRKASYSNNDFVAFSVAKKTIIYQDQEYVIYIVPVRGTTKNAEWFSNFNLGEGNDHEGFAKASAEILSVLKDDFFNIDGSDPEHRKILLTGHSRGAAVSNYVAGKLSEEQDYISLSGVFSYNFACPAVSHNAAVSYTNIFNFNNPGDPIATVPLQDWGFYHYGQTINLEADDNAKSKFKETAQKEYSGTDSTDSYVSFIKKLASSQKDFNTPDNKLLFDLLAYYLGGKTDANITDLFKGNLWSEKGLKYLKQSLIEDPSNLIKLIPAQTREYKELINNITEVQKKVSQDRQEAENAGKDYDFNNWIKDNSPFVEKIEKMTDVAIKTEEDLQRAKDIAKNEALVNLDTTGAALLDLLSLYLGTDGNILGGIEAAHSPDYYVNTINSLYFGYKGWANYSKKTSIIVPENITCIGDRCFYSCTGLQMIELQSNIAKYNTSIGDSQFYGCTGLKNITIPEGVESVEYHAFANCTGLETLMIPDSVKILGEAAFANDTALKEVTVPGDAEYVRNYVGPFEGCTHIEKATYTKGNSGILRGWNDDRTIALSAIESLKEVVIGEGITEIQAYALCGTGSTDSNGEYKGCIERISWPSGLKIVGAHSVKYQDNLTELKLPESITEIDDNAFEASTSMLNAIYLSDELQSIGRNAFGKTQKTLSLYGWKNSVVQTFAEEEGFVFYPIYEPVIKASAKTVDAGDSVSFSAEMYTKDCVKNETPLWSISGAKSNGTVIDESGMLSVGLDEAAQQIIILAEFVNADGKVYSVSLEMGVNAAPPSELVIVENPVLSGTYGDPVSEMSITGGKVLLGENEAEGNWSVTDRQASDQPGIDCDREYELTFSISDGRTVSCKVLPVITPKDICSEGISVVVNDSGIVYDGSAKEVAVAVADEKAVLTRKDYTVTFEDNVNAGQARALITGTGNYFGTRVETFSILQADIADTAAVLSQDSFQADGTEKTPEIIVHFGQILLREGDDYTVSYQNNIDPGTAEALITAKENGNYFGAITLSFTIYESDDGTVIKEDAFRGTSLEKVQIGADVRMIRRGAFADCYNLKKIYFYGDVPEIEEDAFANVKAKAYYPVDHTSWNADVFREYGGQLEWTCWDPETGEEILFSLEEDQCRVSLSEVSFTYSGEQHRPIVGVIYRSNILTEGTDYEVSYTDNVNAGQASVIITGRGIYRGTRTVSFEIKKANALLAFSSSKISKTYGNAVTFTNYLKRRKTDGAVTYRSSNQAVAVINSKSGKVTVKGAGSATITASASEGENYHKTTASYRITVGKAANKITASNYSKISNGKTQSFTMKYSRLGGAKMTFKSNRGGVKVNSAGKVTISATFVGKATITLTAVESKNYKTASLKRYITVNPAPISISSLKNDVGRKIKISWKKNSTATGYEIQYALNKGVSKNVKKIRINKAAVVSKTISGLVKNKVYYVRIRVFKKDGTQNFYSAWSTVKSVKVLK